jgi:hypothetical protein
MTDRSKITEMMSAWPKSWSMMPEDIQIGEQLVAEFGYFVDALVESGLSERTIRRHLDNLWTLGCEIIRNLNFDSKQRNRTAMSLLSDAVDCEGGPLCPDWSLAQKPRQREFDTTCRKLHEFIDGPRSI